MEMMLILEVILTITDLIVLYINCMGTNIILLLEHLMCEKVVVFKNTKVIFHSMPYSE